MSKVVKFKSIAQKVDETEEEISFFRSLDKESKKRAAMVFLTLSLLIVSIGFAILALANLSPIIKKLFLP